MLKSRKKQQEQCDVRGRKRWAASTLAEAIEAKVNYPAAGVI